MRKVPFVLLVLSLFALLTTPATAAATLPGGKTNFVVALGSFKAGTERDNWVRLGDYTFSTTGTVTARTYLWWQRHPAARQSTGTTPNGDCSTNAQAVGQTVVRACPVQTAGGFLRAPDETKTGTFSVSGTKLHITWRTDQTWSEQWAITARADNKLVRLDQTFNSLATAGYAYGSNASLNTGRSMQTVRDYPGTLMLDKEEWAHDKTGHLENHPFEIGKYRTCTTTTWCLTYLLTNPKEACAEKPSCIGTGGGSAINDRSIQNYIQRIASGDRRDTWWSWCTCLTRNPDGTDKEKCYTGNSHVKPMLQILDDDGEFHGWVGVEASFYPRNDSAVPRSHDMLAAFRISDFR
ncbi:hypothetical protein LFM09_17270 [Lentzea alba]|uniref:hypothetical protein n=1 Tax=Lentzea alba TaxID=2714351 RepID=UPI0039BFAAF1